MTNFEQSPQESSNENNSESQQERATPKLEREKLFEVMRKDTRLYSASDYEMVFSPVREHWGINSPAVIISADYLPYHPYQDVVPKNIEGSALIAINGEAAKDQDYIEFLKYHEYWEKYMQDKRGFNLKKRDEVDFNLPILERTRPAHRVAVLKELKMANEYNKLDAYMEWWANFYKDDINAIEKLDESELIKISKNFQIIGGVQEIRDGIITLITKNWKLKEEISEKIRNRTIKEEEFNI